MEERMLSLTKNLEFRLDFGFGKRQEHDSRAEAKHTKFQETARNASIRLGALSLVEVFPNIDRQEDLKGDPWKHR
jgi:hypothetical protein